MSTKGRAGGPPGQRDRKRPAPTIDLKATEVAREPVPPQAPAPPAVDPAPVVAQPDPVPDVAPPAPVPGVQPQMQAEIPPAAPPSAPPPEEAAAPPPMPPPPPERKPTIAWLPPGFPWPMAAAASAGVVLTLAVLAATGVFSGRDSGASPAEARLARVEQQLRELAARPAPAAADPRAVEDLATRVGRLETIAATPKPPVTDTALANRIATLEGEIRALAERAGVLVRRNDEIASLAGEARKNAEATAAALAELRKAQPPAASMVQRAELEALSNRLAALERNAKAIEAQLGSRAGGEGGDRSLRALVANALRTAVEGGTPFVSELDAARAVAHDPKVLAPLERFAKAGVPGVDALARELVALIPALAKAVGTPPRGGGILDRLKANAEKIVRVRPIEEASGDDASAVMARIEARAAQANLAGALAEFGKLPAALRALAKDWIAKVEARDAAVEASRRFAADALAAVGRPSL